MPLDLKQNMSLKSVYLLIGSRMYPQSSKAAIAARLKLLVDVYGGGVLQKFCDLCDLNYDAARKHMDGKTSRLQVEHCLKIWSATGVDINWTLSGYSPSLPLPLQRAIARGELDAIYANRKVEGWPWDDTAISENASKK